MKLFRKTGWYVLLLTLSSLSTGSGEWSLSEVNRHLLALESVKKKIFSYTPTSRKSEKAPADAPAKYPKIIIIKNKLFFDGKELRLGDSLDSWKKIIAGEPRCFEDKPKFCVWDNTGLQTKTRGDQKESVTSFTIYFNFFDVGQSGIKYGVSSSPTPAEVYDWLPHKVFTGYFELDGFGIDSTTRFLDLINRVSNRKLHCGNFDCGNPSGPFSEDADIYISLDSRRDIGRLKEFSIVKDL
jgi:hypothetical protein